MHEYATDARDKEVIARWLLVPTIIAAAVVYALIEGLKDHLSILRDYGWVLDVSSAAFFYDIFRRLVDTHLWRMQFGRIRLSRIPDLNGTWVGVGRTSYSASGQSGTYRVVVFINQTWSKICVELQTKGSISKSSMAAVNTEEAAESGLMYEYINKPRYFDTEGRTPSTMHMHQGVVHLHLDSEGTTMTGHYYTDPCRNNFGDLQLQFYSVDRINHARMMELLEEYTAATDTG